MGNSVSTSSNRLAGMSNLVAEVGDDVQYEKSMGSSRFLKAIKARHRSGLIVVKTFIKPDPSMSLASLVKRLRVERQALADVPNVLTYQKVVETECAGYLIRQWLATNLYDRISTRPFLTHIEKKWITYQLLYAMRDAHHRNVPHGDLKSENILVSSSLIIYVTDFAASFKPTFLPLDDPADFSLFFDTSGRRSCYLAPERFYEANPQLGAPSDPSLPSGITGPVQNRAVWADPDADPLALGTQDMTVTEAMDVFSMGCVIAELWRDGAPTFTLSQLFKYRQGSFDVDSVITEIPDQHVQALVRSMISCKPEDRKSFDTYLNEGNNTAFPESFRSFFHQYLINLQRSTPITGSAADDSAKTATGIPGDTHAPSVTSATSALGATLSNDEAYSSLGRAEADERIERMYEEWSSIVHFLEPTEREADNPVDSALNPDIDTSSALRLNGADEQLIKPESESGSRMAFTDSVFPVQLNIPGISVQILSAPLKEQPHRDGTALIILSIILANVRNCVRPSSKCHALDIILHLASRWLSDETTLDRVIPYVVSLLDDESPQVRLAAIRTCTQLLMMVRKITASNASIIPEYVMPKVKSLSLDPSTAVRSTLAFCIVPIADTGERFLQMAQAIRSEGMFATERDLNGDFLDTQPDESNYDAQFQTLQGLVQELITTLLTDPSASVKRALIANIEPLCSFLGVSKTNDVLLSHMITYLNDRNWLLRGSFFETIVDVAKVAGNRSLEDYILPLMTQAISDSEEFVVAQVLKSLTSLLDRGLSERTKILSILSSSQGFLCHPNVWLREACAGLLSAAVKKLNQADTWTVVYPSLRPLLKCDIYDFSEIVVVENAKAPLSRPVLQAAISWASKSNKTLFWKQPHETKDIAGLRNGLATEGIGRMLGQTGRDLHQTTVGRTEEDDANLDKLRALGMEEEDQVKLIALRGYISRLARQSSAPKSVANRAESDGPESAAGTANDNRPRAAMEVQSLDSIPQTIFFSTKPLKTVPQESSDSASVITGTLRSQNESSFSGWIARKRLAGERISSESSTLVSMREIQRRINNDSSFKNHPGVQASSLQRLSEAIPSKSDDVKEARSSHLGPAGPLHSQAQAILGLGKASAAVAPSSFNATGTMTDRAARLRNQEVQGPPGSPGKSTPAGSVVPASTLRPDGLEAPATDGLRFSSTYEGKDPYIQAHLEAVYLKHFRDRPEFGPKVNSGPLRRRGTKPTMPTAPRSGASGSNRRPEGNLIAYFVEHSGAVSALAVSPDHQFFVTGSEDGTIKVWDTARLEKNVTSRSRATYTAQKGGITAMIALEQSHCIASAARDGSLHVWRVDVSQGTSIRPPRYAKPKLISNFQLSSPGEYATCLIQSTAETSSSLILGTSRCRLTVLDLRTMQVLQSLRNPIEHGPITCLCADKKKAWLLVGTLGGVISLWDLRFGLRLKSWRVGSPSTHESGPGSNVGAFRVNQIVLHPSKGKERWVLVAAESVLTQPASQPQVLVETWDIDKGIRVETFESGTFPASSSSEDEVSQALLPGNDKSSSTTEEFGKKNSAALAIERLLSGDHVVTSTEAYPGAVRNGKDSQANGGQGDEMPLPRSNSPNIDATSSASTKALYVSLEGYASSTLTASTNGWLDISSEPAHAGYMLAAGEDRKIRFWDLGRTEKSVCIGSKSEERSEFKSFGNRHVHQATTLGRSHHRSPLVAHQQDNALGRVHKDAVTAIAVIENPFRCVVAGDRTGCIRVWE